MCAEPNKLSNGQIVACRRCWQCNANKVKDWAGRCIAESKTSVASHAITLTYGRVNGEIHHERSSVLTYSDVQAFLKRLRSNGFPLRYLVAGEYGTTKGRAHWHLIAFWQKKVPEFLFQKQNSNMCHLAEWPHGHINVDKLSYDAVTYCVKYLAKDLQDEGAQAHFSLSKKPPLGDSFFREWADKHVKAGLAPRSEIYYFSDISHRGKKREFFMQGKTKENFCEYFIQKWKETYPDTHLPNSEFIEEYQDKKVLIEREKNEPLILGLADPFAIKTIGFPKAAPDGISEIIMPKGQGLIQSHAYGEKWFWVPDKGGKGTWLSETDRRITADNRKRLSKLSDCN